MLGRYPYVEPSQCLYTLCSLMPKKIPVFCLYEQLAPRRSRSQGEAQLAQILSADITTFVCLQVDSCSAIKLIAFSVK